MAMNDESAPILLHGSTELSGLPGAKLDDFWSWAFSDLVSNTVRPLVAEWLVGRALGLLHRPRIEWDAVDFKYRGHGIEVKSSAAVQTWKQSKPSPIKFDIGMKRPWDSESLTQRSDLCRSAAVYVFCHCLITRANALDVIDPSNWAFYCVPCRTIDEHFGQQKSVRLSRIKPFVESCVLADVQAAIDRLVDDKELCHPST